MNLADSPEEAGFRRRLRAWLADNKPTEVMPDGLEDRHRYLVDWHKELHRGGWIGLSWPSKYGGQGLGPVAEAIFGEELARADAPPGPLLGYIGRPLIQFGSEQQCQRYLPKMLASEELWCQGFSEPGAGSDLAALSTRADDGGDHFVVTGQKIWTSYAQFADYCLLLVRTTRDGAKHRGISALIVDLHSPGVTVRPITQITGDQEFCEVFFDGTPVPKANLVGQLNGGWEIALTTMAYERGPVDIGYVARYQVLLNRLREELAKRGPVPDDVRRKVASASVMIDALRLQCLRSLTRRAAGHPPGPDSSIDKLLMANTEQYLLHVVTEALGTEVLLGDNSWFNVYLYSRAATVYGGTAQIQKNILATRVLGLPRT